MLHQAKQTSSFSKGNNEHAGHCKAQDKVKSTSIVGLPQQSLIINLSSDSDSDSDSDSGPTAARSKAQSKVGSTTIGGLPLQSLIINLSSDSDSDSDSDSGPKGPQKSQAKVKLPSIGGLPSQSPSVNLSSDSKSDSDSGPKGNYSAQKKDTVSQNKVGLTNAGGSGIYHRPVTPMNTAPSVHFSQAIVDQSTAAGDGSHQEEAMDWEAYSVDVLYPQWANADKCLNKRSALSLSSRRARVPYGRCVRRKKDEIDFRYVRVQKSNVTMGKQISLLAYCLTKLSI